MDSARIGRKANDRYAYPTTQRSYYHYNRDYYPSHRIFYWISWPNCCRPICYDWGPDFTFGFFWPYYHRRFVFVSLGGYWPCYTYRRYYWYGCHPYRWYGDCPPEYVVAGDTYNYYYYGSNAPQQESLGPAKEKLDNEPPAEPAEETRADRDFEKAVKAFEAADYAGAADRFHEAMQLAPDDIVLPFARVQALFANGEYDNAAKALRKALVNASPEKEGVFYPRGLYTDEIVLHKQVEQLERAAQLNPGDPDMELLLGYQLLGMGKLDDAAGHLQNAGRDSNNTQAATVLTDLLEKLKKADSSTPKEASKSEEPQAQNVEVK
ncbi:MAG: tetratricopeptide repeat protein [Planctomycetota bacterium]